MNNKELVENIKNGYNDLNVIVQQLTGDTARDRKLIIIYIFKDMMTEFYMQDYVESVKKDIIREIDEMEGDF